MINVRTIKKMLDGDTLNRMIGNCSIQFKNGKYYVSTTEHAYTRRQAREIANEMGVNKIYEWQNLAHMAV